jgi:hypothetical protein
MKILDRQKIDPINLMAGDTLAVEHVENVHDGTGRMIATRRVLAKTVFDASQAMIVDEALLFETEFEDRRALGGMVLEQKK